MSEYFVNFFLKTAFSFLIPFFLSLLIYFEKEKQRGGAKREGERESQAGSALLAKSLMRGSIP